MTNTARKHDGDDDECLLTTKNAAKVGDMTVAALLKAVERGRIVPDAPARKGWTRSHRFRKSTILRYLQGVPSANEG